MAMKIDLDFLKTSLPLLETERKETYSRLTSIFKEIISAETENEAFFKSPLNYLESRQALPSLEIAKGEKLPLIQDEALVQTIRKARDLYKAGKLELKNINANSDKVAVEDRHSWISGSSISEGSHRGALHNWNTWGVSALEIEGRLIGPLADPMVFEKLHASLEAESKKAKG